MPLGKWTGERVRIIWLGARWRSAWLQGLSPDKEEAWSVV